MIHGLIRGVIFDMDGLMLDTEPAYRVAWQQAAVECGYDLPDPLYFRLIGRSRLEGERTLVDALAPASRWTRSTLLVSDARPRSSIPCRR